jgi:putative flippase GtrA
MPPKLSNQFSRFFVGGLVSVSIDWSTYFLLTRFGEIELTVSKVISFIVGTIFAFYYNGVVSFQSNLGKARFMRHLSLYTFSMFINMAVFNSAMKATPVFLGSSSFVSLALATSVSMLINFFGMRSWVFRDKEISK